jgi:hypothetical protein
MMDVSSRLEIIASAEGKRLTKLFANNTEKYRIEIIGANGQWSTILFGSSEYAALSKWQELISTGEIQRFKN